MRCEDGDWSVAIGIDIVPPLSSARYITTCTQYGGFTAAVELVSDRSTSSNDGTPTMPPHTAPLPFIDDLKLRPLSTSINGFQLDDRTTEPIDAHSRIYRHHNKGEKVDAHFSQLARGENPAGCES